MKEISGCWKLDIAAVAHDISTRSLSPVVLTEMMLDRIARIDPKLLCYVTVLRDDAISSARQAEKEIADGHYRGALHVVPIAIKDIYDTKGVRATACSKVRENYVPAEDSTVVRKFREAGAIILGKSLLTSSRSAPTRVQQRMLGTSTTFRRGRAAGPVQQ